MLGNSGYEFFCRGDGKVLLVFAMGHPGMVDYHTGIIVIVQLGSGKRTSNDILSQVGYTGCIISTNTNGIIHAEARVMAPFHDHGDEFIVDQPFLFQHGQHLGTEQFGQGRDADFRHDVENTVSAKESVGNDSVDMWMPFCVVAECLDSQHRTNNPLRQIQSGAKEDKQATSRAPAQFGKQFAIVEKKLAQDDWNGKNILAMGQRIEDILSQQLTKLDNFLGMA